MCDPVLPTSPIAQGPQQCSLFTAQTGLASEKYFVNWKWSVTKLWTTRVEGASVKRYVFVGHLRRLQQSWRVFLKNNTALFLRKLARTASRPAIARRNKNEASSYWEICELFKWTGGWLTNSDFHFLRGSGRWRQNQSTRLPPRPQAWLH